MLSDYTGAWQLYFGLLFIAMVMFAPGGIAGLIMLHVPLVYRRTLHRVLPHYLVMAVPSLLGLAGLVARSAASRAGKGSASKCRFRGTPDHSIKKMNRKIKQKYNDTNSKSNNRT